MFVIMDDGLRTSARAAKQQGGQQEWEHAAHVVAPCYALRAPILWRPFTGQAISDSMAATVRARLSIAEVSITGQALAAPLEPFRPTRPLVFVTWRRALLGIAR